MRNILILWGTCKIAWRFPKNDEYILRVDILRDPQFQNYYHAASNKTKHHQFKYNASETGSHMLKNRFKVLM